MIRKFTVIFAVGVFLIAAANLFADEKVDEEKAPAFQKEFQNRQSDDLQESGNATEAGQYPVPRRRVRALRNKQVEVEVVTKRVRADRPQPPIRQQAPARLRRVVQLQNRWFNALKDAYSENDIERIGRLIRKMEQFKKQMRNRMESAQEMRPIPRQRYRRADEGYQPQGRMRNFRGQRRNRRPVDEAPAFRRQRLQAQRRRFRMQDVPDRQLRRPAEPPTRGACQNCNCEKCKQLRAGQQRRLGRPGAEGRGPNRFGQYGDGLQQRRLRQRRGGQQQWLPKENVPENEELDFDWDW